MHLIVEDDRLANGGRIAAEPVLPMVVAEHDDRRAVAGVFLRQKRPAQYRGRTQQRKETLRYEEAARVFGSIGRSGHTVPLISPCELLENVTLFAPVPEPGERGEQTIGSFRDFGLIEAHQMLGILVGTRTQHDGIDNTEDRRSGSDSDRQNRHDDDRKTRVLPQLAETKRYVLP